MSEPEERDLPTLEDELLGPGADPDEVGLRAERGPLLPWELKEAPNRREIALGGAGFLTFTFVDAVMMYAPLRHTGDVSVLPQTVTLAALAFGLGGLLIVQVRGAWRPFGYGMMLGWVFLTLISLGFLTGLSP